MTTKIRIITISLAIFISLSFAANASDVEDLTEFSVGTPAKAAEVNANFDAVKEAVDDNYAIIQTKDCVTCEDDALKVPALKFDPAKTGSMSYSSMGFSPNEGEVLIAQGNPYYNLSTRYTKDKAQGFLRTLGDDGIFYHNVTLRSGLKMIGFHAHVRSDGSTDLVVRLMKKSRTGAPLQIARITYSGEEVDVESAAKFTPEVIESWGQLNPNVRPVAYFIEVTLNGPGARFYSATIEYEYDEP